MESSFRDDIQEISRNGESFLGTYDKLSLKNFEKWTNCHPKNLDKSNIFLIFIYK